jgi:hypothetical protein
MMSSPTALSSVAMAALRSCCDELSCVCRANDGYCSLPLQRWSFAARFWRAAAQADRGGWTVPVQL